MSEQEQTDSLPKDVPPPVLPQDDRRLFDPPPGSIGYLERYGIFRPKE